MSETVDTSTRAFCKRAGVTPSAVNNRKQPNMTIPEKIADNNEWVGEIDARMRKDANLRAALLTQNVALQQELAAQILAAEKLLMVDENVIWEAQNGE